MPYVFAGAVIHGGHFNINIHAVKKSPTFTTNHVYKRLKVIESSDEDVYMSSICLNAVNNT